MCKVHVPQTSSLFANSGSEDQRRGVESKLLGLKVGGQLHFLDLGWIRISVKNSGLKTVGLTVSGLGDYDTGLNSQGSRNEA